MSIWAERKVRRKPEEQDPGWDRSRSLVALRSLRDSARDSLTTDEDLVELVLQVMDTLPPWAPTDHRRCWVYLSRLTAQPLPMDEEQPTDARRHRLMWMPARLLIAKPHAWKPIASTDTRFPSRHKRVIIRDV